MNFYLIESTHTKEDCRHIMQNFWAYGHVTHFVWGCEEGQCAGWAIIEAENEDEALLSVPSLVRNSTKITKVKKFSPEELQHFHEDALNESKEKK